MSKRTIKPDDVVWYRDMDDYRLTLIIPDEITYMTATHDDKDFDTWHLKFRTKRGSECFKKLTGTPDYVKNTLNEMVANIHNGIPFWI